MTKHFVAPSAKKSPRTARNTIPTNAAPGIGVRTSAGPPTNAHRGTYRASHKGPDSVGGSESPASIRRLRLSAPAEQSQCFSEFAQDEIDGGAHHQVVASEDEDDWE
jgi:hypothetical protein